MGSWLKTLWKDLSDLSGIIFLCKYILPLLIFLFIWIVIGKWSQSSLTTKSLIATTGQVISIRVEMEKGLNGKNKYYPLKILLYKAPVSFEGFKNLKQFKNLFEDFRLIDHFSSRFAEIKNEIHQSDTIIVYTRNGWQTLFAGGKENNIYQIEKNGKIIFPIKDMVGYEKGQLTINAALLLICLIAYLIYRNWNKKKKRITSAELLTENKVEL